MADLVRPSPFIAGVDEVGTGALAGPVYAAICALPVGWEDVGVRDSKQLSESRREALYENLTGTTMWAVGSADVAEIDKHNILRASHLAMRRAIEQFVERWGTPDLIRIDGNKTIFGVSVRQEAIVKGDQKHAEISAASILAKVTRDRVMCKLDQKHPGYGFSEHKGYGTPAHYAALEALGYSDSHRYFCRRKLREAKR